MTFIYCAVLDNEESQIIDIEMSWKDDQSSDWYNELIDAYKKRYPELSAQYEIDDWFYRAS